MSYGDCEGRMCGRSTCDVCGARDIIRAAPEPMTAEQAWAKFDRLYGALPEGVDLHGPEADEMRAAHAAATAIGPRPAKVAP